MGLRKRNLGMGLVELEVLLCKCCCFLPEKYLDYICLGRCFPFKYC